MKNLIIILIFLLSSYCISFSQDSKINFRNVKHSEIFQIAKKENKPIMIYFHYDGCGGCVKMEKNVFTNAKAAQFYNDNFICYKVNTRKGEGIEINKIYKVKMHPAFFYMDSEGSINHKMVGAFSTVDFIQHGKNSLNPHQTLSYYKTQYKNGNRNANFLLKYSYLLRDAFELDSVVINQYLSTQPYEELAKPENIQYIYEFAVHNFKTNLGINSDSYRFLLHNKEKFAKFFEKDQIDTRIVWIAHSFAMKAAEKLDENLFNQAIDIIKKYENGKRLLYKEMDGRITGAIEVNQLVLYLKMDYYEKTGKNKEYLEAEEKYIKNIWNDWDVLNEIAWRYYDYDDTSKLKKAKKWAKRSVELTTKYENCDTYAAILLKLSEGKEALHWAEKAAYMAKKDSLDHKYYKEALDLIEKIESETKK